MSLGSPPKNGGVTITQLARKLDLSVATISLVMSGRWQQYGIAKTTADRVKRAARGMKYIRNAMARNLRQLKSGLIGIVFPHLRNDWAHRILSGMHDVILENGKIPFIISHGENAEEEAKQIDTLIEHRPDALIINPIVKGLPTYRRLRSLNIPLVFLSDALSELPDVPCVGWDPEEAALAINHLIAVGHRKIGFVGIEDRRVVARQRLQVFTKTLATAGIRARKRWIMMMPPGADMEAGIRSALASTPDRPTALFCVYDDCAFAACESAARLGLRIPDDLAIATLGDSRAAGPMAFDLTTVAAPIEKEGEAAARLALEIISSPNRKHASVMVRGGTLIPRGSSRA